MKLNVQDRLILVNVVPEKGTFTTMTIVEELKAKFYPSEKEIKEFDIKHEGNSIMWNKKGAEDKEIPLTESQLNLILDQFEKLSKTESLDYNTYLVYKKLKNQTENKETKK